MIRFPPMDSSIQQISIYRNGVKWANVVVGPLGPRYIQNVTGVPHIVMSHIRNFAAGAAMLQKYMEWTWEWQRQGSPAQSKIVPN